MSGGAPVAGLVHTLPTRARPQAPRAPIVALILAAGASLATPAHALFSDDEARKAILELRARVTANDEATRARLSELSNQLAALTGAQAAAQAAQAVQNKEMADAVQALRRSLLELNNQIDGLRAELARLRGEQEQAAQAAREAAEAQRRQRDLFQAIDDRLRRLEPVTVSLDGQEFLAGPEEKRQFDDALAHVRAGEFDRALAAFGAFGRRFPASGYADAVRFWVGNAHYFKREHREAIAAFRGFVTASPKHPRAPDALLAIADSQAEMKDRPGARRTIDELMKAYPQSEAAAAGKERLATLR